MVWHTVSKCCLGPVIALTTLHQHNFWNISSVASESYLPCSGVQEQLTPQIVWGEAGIISDFDPFTQRIGSTQLMEELLVTWHWDCRSLVSKWRQIDHASIVANKMPLSAVWQCMPLDSPCTMKMTSEYKGELKRFTRVWGPSWAARALGVSLAPCAHTQRSE